MLIPEVLILPLIAILILSRTYTYQWFILTGAIALFLIHLIIHLIVPDGFGMGDVFYAAAVGLMLPPHLLLVWFVTTYALGTIVGLGLIGLNKMERKTPLPFAQSCLLEPLLPTFWKLHLQLVSYLVLVNSNKLRKTNRNHVNAPLFKFSKKD